MTHKFMTHKLRGFICNLLNCCSEHESALNDCILTKTDLQSQLNTAHETIHQLELLVPGPIPPTIDYVVYKDSDWIQYQIDSMGMDIIRLPLNTHYPMTNQTNTLNVIAWDWTDTLPYIRDKFDCEMFAMHFMVKTALHFGLRHIGLVLDYKSGHSYNLVLYPDGNKMILDPMFDGIYVWPKRPEVFYPLQGAKVAI